MAGKIVLAGWVAYAAWLAEEAGDMLVAADVLADAGGPPVPAGEAFGQAFGPDGWRDAATWSPGKVRP
jgi:hypothetical protein